MTQSTQGFLEYRNPLTTRYASTAMSRIFSEHHRASLWRRLWIVLAEEQKKLGLKIRPDQIAEMKKQESKIDFDRVRAWELKLKHDVMSHVKAFGEATPKAEAIIHLGATSAFVTDNADVLIIREASELVHQKLCVALAELRTLIEKWKSVTASGFTHFQPAQPVTMGKRLSVWAQDLCWDIEEIEFCLSRLRPLGCKGATGTQASFLTLFEGDSKKVEALDLAIAKRLGFESAVAVSGQTLSRKVDSWFLDALSHMASTASKLSYDFRLLQHTGELKEPFGKAQVGSSAMAYKRNPILAERLSSLARFLMTLSTNGVWTHGVQWLERSLDDSANRRIVLAEAFLAADAMAELLIRLFKKPEIDRKRIQENLKKYEADFASEAWMMEQSLKGESRQKAHEKVRAAKFSGKLTSSKRSKAFGSGLAARQVDLFLKQELNPFLKQRQKQLKKKMPSSAAAL
ncbi:MAG: adenylosuccinate lyase [Bradymonadales bacterium]|nr:MAG: adenylosuccinate lyase [Bradymonadales bacterium]